MTAGGKRRWFGIAVIVFNMLLAAVLLTVTLAVVFSSGDAAGPTVFGCRLLFAVTDAMSPVIDKHALFLTKRIDPGAEVNPGDILTFRREDGSLATLRMTGAGDPSSIEAEAINAATAAESGETYSREQVVCRYITSFNWITFLTGDIYKPGAPGGISWPGLIKWFAVFAALMLAPHFIAWLIRRRKRNRRDYAYPVREEETGWPGSEEISLPIPPEPAIYAPALVGEDDNFEIKPQDFDKIIEELLRELKIDILD